MSSQEIKISAGIIPILKWKEGPLFLLLRSYNYWDFSKGLVEKEEAPFLAAQRELFEETGIHDVNFPFGEIYIETEVYGPNKKARYYLGLVHSQDVHFGINPELGRAEHQEYRWLPFAEAQRLLVPRVKRVLQWAEKTLQSGAAL